MLYFSACQYEERTEMFPRLEDLKYFHLPRFILKLVD